MSASGGEAVQITRQSAFEMFAAADGETIIYSKGNSKSGLWQVGNERRRRKTDFRTRRSRRVAFVDDRRVAFAENTVYYTAFNAQPPFKIWSFDLRTRQNKEIGSVQKTPLAYYPNLSVAADGKSILYARQDQSQSAIMLAELSK